MSEELIELEEAIEELQETGEYPVEEEIDVDEELYVEMGLGRLLAL